MRTAYLMQTSSPLTLPRFAARVPSLAALRTRLGLGAILLVAALANFVNLAQNGYGNTYYASAVKSMTQSWHNFFFVAFDPGGFVTVDKPPVALWIQAIFAKVFGFSGLALMLPEAIAGVASVALLFYLVRRTFGDLAGLLAALALAISPVNIAVNRDNTVDAILVLAVLGAAWAVLVAIERGSWRWLVLGAALAGVAFNVKMLEAYLVVPALGLAYLLGAPRTWKQRFGHLALAAVVLLAVTFLWVGIVDATPAAQRPYVGSSQDNSEISLAFGYNGLQRLLGLFGRGSAFSGGNANAGGFFAGETGAPGLLRLFSTALGGQAGWLLPLALIALLAALWPLFAHLGRVALAAGREGDLKGKLRGVWQEFVALRLTREQSAWVLWGAWLVTCYGFFSVAGFFHAYYLSIMAPAIAALVGAGVVLLWRDYRAAGRSGWLLPIAVALTAIVQARLLAPYPGYAAWLVPLVLILGLGGALVLAWLRLLRQPTVPEWAHRANAWLVERTPRLDARRITSQAITSVLGVSVASMLLVPATWSYATAARSGQGLLPSAGPSPTMTFTINGKTYVLSRGMGGGFGDVNSADSALIAYLETHRAGANYLLATFNAQSAAPIILATGQPVMAIGGFTGSDPILTTTQFAVLVAKGQVRYVMLQGVGNGGRRHFGDLPEGFPGRGFGGFPGGFRDRPERPTGGFGGFMGSQANAALMQWVQKNCKTVPATSYGGTNSSGMFAGQLYQCGTQGTVAQTH
jgi:4-amino-4-deoxy-L-arabinose transferase-like glycosyltransferase